jgi:hypothetical protein
VSDRKTLLVSIDSQFRSTTTDAIRVFVTDGDKPNAMLSFAVMVRMTSEHHELHDTLSQDVCDIVNAAIRQAFFPAKNEETTP